MNITEKVSQLVKADFIMVGALREFVYFVRHGMYEQAMYWQFEYLLARDEYISTTTSQDEWDAYINLQLLMLGRK